ncbi:OmpA family protein [Croceicoccus bisphenolivorans]|uniref:OmpA family protein n=1 Tax=Croceicoccus bisphenolivorans TaxID=1783232 RepID=UPI000833A9A8|nr:OmpA family protein [Croceicoccus bisphenolivorans]
MIVVTGKPMALSLLALLALPVSAQAADGSDNGVYATVIGDRASEGPKIEGVIAASSNNVIEVAMDTGDVASINLDSGTKIKGGGGFLGMGGKDHGAESLLPGLPVTVETMRWGNQLVATEVKFKGKQLEMAQMVRNGTSRQFAAHSSAIAKNKAMADALRDRMADIDKYNIKGTTNVYFDTGKYGLTPDAEQNLCAAAQEADSMDNALLLVVGYTDSTGSYEVNQTLSEKRAGRVVNYLQQACGWKPWRMLSPTGMASADPLADNSTPEGKAQNRRVAVNILVSKSVDGM